MTEICPICSKAFEQETLDSAATIIGMNIFRGVRYCSEKCIEEFKRELEPIVLKARMDELEERIKTLEAK